MATRARNCWRPVASWVTCSHSESGISVVWRRHKKPPDPALSGQSWSTWGTAEGHANISPGIQQKGLPAPGSLETELREGQTRMALMDSEELGQALLGTVKLCLLSCFTHTKAR